MELLKVRNEHVRENNQRIHQWVESYLRVCLENNQCVTLLTPWCLSVGLRKRNETIPTEKELNLFREDLPSIYQLFKRCSFEVNWFITFHRGFPDSRRIDFPTERRYKSMISSLAEPHVRRGWLMLQDWEDEILNGKRVQPHSEVLANPKKFVSEGALEREFLWTKRWLENETGLRWKETSVRRDIIYQIACEAEEGRFLAGSESPFGQDFLLVPLEVPEQYDFFSIFAPEFKQRIVSVLPLYPWRIKDVK